MSGNTAELGPLAQQLTTLAVEHFDHPMQLRGGGESNWYVDSRRGLSSGEMLLRAAKLIEIRTQRLGLSYEVVAGMGIAGRALAVGVTLAGNEAGRDVSLIEANDDKSSGQRYGYGLHGADVKDRKVLAVDDIATTGSSLLALIEMIRGAGGEVEDAIVLSDRSQGKVAERMAEIGVRLHWLLNFEETTGQLVPAEF